MLAAELEQLTQSPSIKVLCPGLPGSTQVHAAALSKACYLTEISRWIGRVRSHENLTVNPNKTMSPKEVRQKATRLAKLAQELDGLALADTCFQETFRGVADALYQEARLLIELSKQMSVQEARP